MTWKRYKHLKVIYMKIKIINADRKKGLRSKYIPKIVFEFHGRIP